MHRYLWEGRDPDGNRRSERVEAANATAAREQLTRRGWTELRLITDEIAEIAGRGVEVPDDLREEVEPSAEFEVAQYRGHAPGLFGQWARAVWDAKGTSLVALGLTLTGIYLDRNWLFYAGVALLGFQVLSFPVLWFWFGRTMRLYSRLNHAKVWGRWDEVLRIVEQMRRAGGATGIGVGELELARCRAQALAARGQLDQAIKDFSRFEHSEQCPHWLYCSHLGGIFDEARQFERSLELKTLAANENPENASLWVDLASAFVRHLNRPDEARRSLARAEAGEVPELGLPYLELVRGWIAWRESSPALALPHFQAAARGFAQFKQHELVEGLILLTNAHVGLMHGLLGDRDQARRSFQQTRVFLQANREDELLAAIGRCLSTSRADVTS